MSERLSYAAIGFFFGAVLAAVFWWLYGLGFSSNLGPSPSQSSFWPWLKYLGGGGAVAGFVLKERVGDLAGLVFRGAYEAEAFAYRGPEVPAWVIAVLLAVVASVAWFFLRSATP